ncbi:hypothetical protein [Psittacicella melopsittaci]|nr:hypothetical protein [Psittacicella melopsittaci]
MAKKMPIFSSTARKYGKNKNFSQKDKNFYRRIKADLKAKLESKSK